MISFAVCRTLILSLIVVLEFIYLKIILGLVFDLFAKGALKITINQRYALQDIAKAHAELESGKTSGSSVIIP